MLHPPVFRFVVGRKTFFSLIFLIMFVSWFFLEHFRMTRANWWARSDLMEKFLNSFVLGELPDQTRHRDNLH